MRYDPSIRSILLACCLIGMWPLAAQTRGEANPPSSPAAEEGVPARAPQVGATSSPKATPPASPTSPAPDQSSPPADGLVGLKLYLLNQPCFIEEVVKGSPAEAAGLRAGEILEAVNGNSVAGLKYPEITRSIRGPIGTTVTLTVRRPGEASREVVVSRGAPVEPPKREGFVPPPQVRLMGYVQQGNLERVRTTLEEVRAQQNAALYSKVLVSSVVLMARSDKPEVKAEASALFPKALAEAPMSDSLFQAAIELYLGAETQDPTEAIACAQRGLEALKPLPKSEAKTLAESQWLAMWGHGQVLSGQVKEGYARLEQAWAMPQDMDVQVYSPSGVLRWESTRGFCPQWEWVAEGALKANKPERAAALALEARRFEESEGADRILASALEAKKRLKVDTRAYTGKAWGASPTPAPPLELVGINGEHWTLEEAKGKVVVVSLWASWCGPCIQELEAFKGLYERNKDKGLEILAVSQDEDLEKVPPFVNKGKYPFPIGTASKRSAIYRSSNVPITLIINQAGMIESTHVGFGEESLKELEQHLLEMIADPESANPALVESAYHLEAFELKAHLPISRVEEVVAARGAEGPEVWVRRVNGDLEIAHPTQSAEEGSASSRVSSSLKGYGRFDAMVALDVNGDGVSERALIDSRAGLFVLEEGSGRQTLLMLSREGRIPPVFLPGQPPVLLFPMQTGLGLEAVSLEGARVWSDASLESTSHVVGPVGPRGQTVLAALRPGELQSKVTLVDSQGATLGGFASSYPMARLDVMATGPGSPLELVLAEASQVRAVDFEGDGKEEVVVLDRGIGLLYLFSHEGVLVGRLTLQGSRLTMDVGELDGKPGEEVVVGGESLGVVIIGMK